MLKGLCLQVGLLTTFAILLHEIPHEVRSQNSLQNCKLPSPI